MGTTLKHTNATKTLCSFTKWSIFEMVSRSINMPTSTTISLITTLNIGLYQTSFKMIVSTAQGVDGETAAKSALKIQKAKNCQLNYQKQLRKLKKVQDLLRKQKPANQKKESHAAAAAGCI